MTRKRCGLPHLRGRGNSGVPPDCPGVLLHSSPILPTPINARIASAWPKAGQGHIDSRGGLPARGQRCGRRQTMRPWLGSQTKPHDECNLLGALPAFVSLTVSRRRCSWTSRLSSRSSMGCGSPALTQKWIGSCSSPTQRYVRHPAPSVISLPALAIATTRVAPPIFPMVPAPSSVWSLPAVSSVAPRLAPSYFP